MHDPDTPTSRSANKRDIALTLILSIAGITALLTYREIRGDISLWEHYLALTIAIIAIFPIYEFLRRRIMTNSDTPQPKSEKKRAGILGAITTIIALTPFVVYRVIYLEIRGDISLWEHCLALAIALILTLALFRLFNRRT